MNAMAQQVAVDRVNVLEGQLAQLKAELHVRAGLPLPPQTARIASIVESAALLFKVSRPEILGESRARKVVQARDAVAWVARLTAGYSSPRIGRELGGRDHSTILTALKRAEQWRDGDGDYRQATDALLAWFTPKSEREEADHGHDC